MSRKPPFSGYSIAEVYSTSQERQFEKAAEDEADHEALSFGWDWRWVEVDTFEVRIVLTISSSADRPERISTDVIGRFRIAEDHAEIKPEEFAKLQAVAILLPYGRQCLTTLTSSSQFGAYYLPTLNIHVLMEDTDPSKATAATQERPKPLATKKELTAGGSKVAHKKK